MRAHALREENAVHAEVRGNPPFTICRDSLTRRRLLIGCVLARTEGRGVPYHATCFEPATIRVCKHTRYGSVATPRTNKVAIKAVVFISVNVSAIPPNPLQDANRLLWRVSRRATTLGFNCSILSGHFIQDFVTRQRLRKILYGWGHSASESSRMIDIGGRLNDHWTQEKKPRRGTDARQFENLFG